MVSDWNSFPEDWGVCQKIIAGLPFLCILYTNQHMLQYYHYTWFIWFSKNASTPEVVTWLSHLVTCYFKCSNPSRNHTTPWLRNDIYPYKYQDWDDLESRTSILEMMKSHGWLVDPSGWKVGLEFLNIGFFRMELSWVGSHDLFTFSTINVFLLIQGAKNRMIPALVNHLYTLPLGSKDDECKPFLYG